jgi:major membrane immunogen (membrane-anchored lipoprotein)
MIFNHALGKLFLEGVISAVLLSACTGQHPSEKPRMGIVSKKNVLVDGYYTAEAAAFDRHGWKDFITIYIENNLIVAVEYDGKNAGGLLKTWDMEYMRQMDAVWGNYPSKYTRSYTGALLNRQDPEKIDVMSGATVSYESFKVLARAVIEQAKNGEKKVAVVELSGK